MLTRTALVTLPPDRARVAATFRELGRVFAELAKDPGDRATRQAAVDRAALVAKRFEHEDVPPGSPLAAVVVCLRLVAADLLLFAGVPREQILEASPEATSP